MSLQELSSAMQMGVAGILIVILGMIKIPKLEINFWTFVVRTLGKALNTELAAEVKKFHVDTDKKIDDIAQELNEHIKQQAEEKASNARRSFLVFNEELYANKFHTKEHFEEILRNIDDYEDYCADHPLYENNKAELAIENIRRVYQYCVKNHTFLGPDD